VTIEWKNSGQCDASNSALESIEMKGILISSFKSF
jgi:hypothetical protein